MNIAHASGRRGRGPVTVASLMLSVAVIFGTPMAPAASPVRAAESSPLAVVVVGPSSGSTSQYRAEARQVADQLRAYGARVREVHSPEATWTAVKTAARGANLFVYIGRGRGYPSPYGRLDTRQMSGLGLNRTTGNGNSNVAYYGEYYVRRDLDLAAGAVVILKRVPYAAGSSEPGRAYPTARTAVQRADNYAAGFLGAGAAAVFASDRSVGTIVRDLFKSNRTIQSVFWNSPSTSTRYDTAFTSRRTSGRTGILAPYGPGRYHQSVVGRLRTTATDWRRTWDPTVPVPPASPSVRVGSIPALLNALANDSITDIVVANGMYRVSSAATKASNSLWIGQRFAGRTRPVTVRAETTGGVTFDGGGAGSFGGLTFLAGAHHQTWDGFTFQNGIPTDTGVIVFGGYRGQAAPHNITLRNILIRNVSPSGLNGHAIYFSWAQGGPHDLVFDGLTVTSPDFGLKSALHFYHSDASNQNAWNVTVRRMSVNGTNQAVMIWDRTAHDIVIEDSTITGAERNAIRYEYGDAITIRRVTSTGSGQKGFFSSLGSTPPGVSIVESSLH